MTDLHWIIIVSSTVLVLLTAAFLAGLVLTNRRIIVEQRTALDKVRASEARFRALFQNAIAGMLTFDPATLVVHDANLAALAIFRVKDIASLNARFGASIEDVREEMERAIRRDGSFAMTDLMVTDDDGRVSYLVFSGRVEDDGRLVHAVLVDVSDQRRLEEMYLKAQKVETVALLTGSLAHDLQNLLAPIQLSMRLLKEHVRTAAGRRIVRASNMTLRHGITLITNILSLGKNVRGNYRPLHLQTVLRRAVDLCERRARVTVRLEAGKGDFVVEGDDSQLKQVFINLVQNAQDAMPRGGTVRVMLDELPPAPGAAVIGGPAEERDYYRVSVADSGGGIPAQRITAVFEPFNSTRKKEGGTGIGLAVVREIVKHHRGFITVESALHKGATFCIFLPKRTPAHREKK